MKKIILSLFALGSVYAAPAASCVSVQQVSTNYASKQITFDLKWGTCNNTNHLYRVWVFMDYRAVTGATKGAWTRAAISATGKGTLVSANKGVWVTGSANATQRVTLTLNVPSTKFDWCAFAIDFPPNATRNNSNGTYTLKGTAPFIINGNTTWNAKTYTGNITAITDATSNPEGFVNVPGCTANYIALGAVGFISTQTWVVGNQTWSAPVTATYCNKTSFNGGSSGAYNSDCRTGGSTSHGHLFSWCMVAKFAATLCPNGWRVPTTTDFCTLDKALNSRSDCSARMDATSRNRYLSTIWGGQYWGAAYSGSIYWYGQGGYCWSQSEYNADLGSFWEIDFHGRVAPQDIDTKAYGFTLRCVK